MNFGGFLNRINRIKRRKNKDTDQTMELVTINASSPRDELPFPEYTTSSLSQRPLKGIGGTPRRKTYLSNDEGTPAVPSLFLQEGAHLVSLLSAVALSGLRCDFEYADAPLTKFIPGHHWPHYNSDNDPDMKQYGYKRNGFVTTIKYMMDISRTKQERLVYNAARPFAVIGGLSDREAFLLQRARGPVAKTALAFMWLNEFIIREQQHGSLGSVAPPIVSRLQQYSSDGHMWYNSARKMSYIPLPFPHTQMTTLVVIACVFLMPTLMLSKAQVWFGMILNFTVVLLFAGLNEISKELEFPFRNMPNDLPLNLFQAQFNEALVTMFSGFHPDAWWEIEGDDA